MIRKVGVSMLMSLALILAVSCGKDAKKAIDDAQLSLTQAQDAGADQYAPDEYKSAEGLLSKARDEYSGRDYKQSQADAVSSKEQSDLALKRSQDRKAEGAKAKAAQPETTVAYNVSTLGEETVPIEDQAKAALKDINFSFDATDLDDAAKEILVANAKWLADHPDLKIQVEGHCDERGSEDYNLALGEKRAKAVRDYLVSLGISPAGLSIISYGKTMPLDPGHTEDAWFQNRRAHFAIQK